MCLIQKNSKYMYVMYEQYDGLFLILILNMQTSGTV